MKSFFSHSFVHYLFIVIHMKYGELELRKTPAWARVTTSKWNTYKTKHGQNVNNGYRAIASEEEEWTENS